MSRDGDQRRPRAAAIGQLKAAIEASWGPDTCACHPSLYVTYMRNNPALGQCISTALVVQDFAGGQLMRAFIRGDGRRPSLQ